VKKRKKLPTLRPASLTDEQRRALVALHREAAEIVADIAAASTARCSSYIRENIERNRTLQAKVHV
jgi:hypothetical protein